MFHRAILVLSAMMAANANAQTSLVRTSAFEYDLSSGLLIREVIEPNISDLCLVTTYAYGDPYGNRTGATLRNCNGTPFNDGQNPSEAAAPTCPGPTCDAFIVPRTSSTSFAATAANPVPGQFPTSSTNALNHTESREFDARFGTAKKLTGPNGLATNWTYDDFGRKTAEIRADLTRTDWFYERCVDLGSVCPPLGVYRVRVTTLGAPTASTYYDNLNRAIRTEAQSFDGALVRQDTEFDALGRVARASRPFVVGSTPVWTNFSYDILGRTVQVDEPTVNGDSTRTVTAYNGLVTSVALSNAGSGTGMPGGVAQVRTTTRNSQGQVISITQQ